MHLPRTAPHNGAYTYLSMSIKTTKNFIAVVDNIISSTEKAFNKYRNLSTQQMLVHSLVCIFPRHVSPLLVAIFRWFVI
jgi:hypothetical protein